MKEQPPFSVLLASGLTAAYSGTVFAEMLLPALEGSYSIYSGFIMGLVLGFGLFKGFEISRFWIALSAGIACFVHLSIGFNPEAGWDSKSVVTNPFAWVYALIFALFAGLTFWGARTMKTREFCRDHTLPTKTALVFTGLFFVLGTAAALPLNLMRKQAGDSYAVDTKFTFTTANPGESIAGPIVYHGPRAFDDKALPKLMVDTRSDDTPERNPMYMIKGIATRPTAVRFTMEGYRDCEYVITNGTPSVVRFKMVKEKQGERAERNVE